MLWRLYLIYSVYLLFHSDLHMLKKPRSQKIRDGNAGIGAGCSLDPKELSGSSQNESGLLEMMARLLPCPTYDTAIQEAENPTSLINPCSLCPSSSGWGRWDCSAACFFLPSGNRPYVFLAGRLCPFKSKHLQFSKSKVEVQWKPGVPFNMEMFPQVTQIKFHKKKSIVPWDL